MHRHLVAIIIICVITSTTIVCGQAVSEVNETLPEIGKIILTEDFVYHLSMPTEKSHDAVQEARVGLLEIAKRSSRGSVRTLRVPGVVLLKPSQIEESPVVWDLAADGLWTIRPGPAMPSTFFGLGYMPIDGLERLHACSEANYEPLADCRKLNSELQRTEGVDPLDAASVFVRTRGKHLPFFYDFQLLDDDLVALCVLYNGHVSLWTCEFDRQRRKAATQPALRGPSVFGDGKWQRITTFGVPFEAHFRVFFKHDRLYIMTGDGRLILARGIQLNKRLSTAPNPLLQATPHKNGRGRSVMGEEDSAKLFGSPNDRVIVEVVPEVRGVSLMIVDRAKRNAFFIAEQDIWEASLPIAHRRASRSGHPPKDASAVMGRALLHLPDIETGNGSR